MKIEEINPDQEYPRGAFSGIVLADGRRLDEALRNHPLAPKFHTKARPGHFYVGSDVLAFLKNLEDGSIYRDNKLISSRFSEMRHELTVAKKRREELLALEKRVADAIKESCNQYARLKQSWEEAADAIRLSLNAPSKEVKGLCLESVSGVYFLFMDRKIVYIGQSVDVLQRVKSHKDKQFDNFKFIRCDVENLNRVEGFFINLLRPPLNGGSGDRICAPSTDIESFEDLTKFFMPGSDLA